MTITLHFKSGRQHTVDEVHEVKAGPAGILLTASDGKIISVVPYENLEMLHNPEATHRVQGVKLVP
jgi:predicted NAD/FAD-binding protein